VPAPDSPDWTTNIARPSLQLVGSPWAYPSGVHTLSFAIQADCHAIAVLVPDHLNVNSVLVTGDQTGTQYFNSALVGGSPNAVIFAQVVGALDTSVSVRIDAVAGNTAYLAQIFDPQVVTADIYPSTVNVEILGVSGLITFNTSLLGSLTPPWLSANQTPLTISITNLANNGVSAILPAIVGRKYYLHTLYLTPTGAGFGWSLQDTSGNEIGRSDYGQVGTATNAVLPSSPPIDLHGAPMATGVGVSLKNISGATATWWGMLCYSF